MQAKIPLNYENQWVALSKDRSKVLYAAKSLDILLKQVPKLKSKDVILHFVPPLDGYLSL